MTYLNMSQEYILFIKDSATSSAKFTPSTYQTSIRVSFEKPHEQQNAAHQWDLWRYTRKADGTSRGNRFSKAVELGAYPEATIHLQNAGVDGFSFTWTTTLKRPFECSVPISFNFLSTDFHEAKGVEGSLLRLNVTNQEIDSGSYSELVDNPQTSYCLIKVFRTHGAERKMANDYKSMKKKMEKLERVISSQTKVFLAQQEKKKSRPKFKFVDRSFAMTTGPAPKRQRVEDPPASSVGSAADHKLVAELARLELKANSSKAITTFYSSDERQIHPAFHEFGSENVPMTPVDDLEDESVGDSLSFDEMVFDDAESSRFTDCFSSPRSNEMDAFDFDLSSTSSFSPACQGLGLELSTESLPGTNQGFGYGSSAASFTSTSQGFKYEYSPTSFSVASQGWGFESTPGYVPQETKCHVGGPPPGMAATNTTDKPQNHSSSRVGKMSK